MTATSGQKCLESLEKLSPDGSLARMFSALLIGMEGWYSTKCKLTWKLKGTKYSRMYCQLYPSTLPTEETEYGLLPTPKAMDGMAENVNSGKELKLINGSFVNIRPKDGMRFGPSLNDIAKKGMLPTPNARDWKDTGNAEKLAQKAINNQSSVPREIALRTGMSGQLSPQFVMEMMGFPTDWTLLPFLNGETIKMSSELAEIVKGLSERYNGTEPVSLPYCTTKFGLIEKNAVTIQNVVGAKPR